MISRRNRDEEEPVDRAPDRILRIRTVLERTGLSRSTLYRKIEEGRFPRQIAISARCTGWRESAVNEWLENPMGYTTNDRASNSLDPAPLTSQR